MGNRRKGSFLKKIVIIGAVLALFELGYILLRRGEAPLTVQEAINQKINKMAISPERKVALKVQLAINDFMIANKGFPPKELNELVPKYFDRLPNDPATGKPFEYRVDGRKFQLGTPASKTEASSGSAPKSAASPAETMTREEQQALIAMMERESQKERAAYDPSSKRDPFRPYDVSPDLQSDSDKTPLERYEASQWFLTAVIDSTEGPTAMLQNPTGQAYSVKKGSRIGLRGGEVVEITSDHVSVLETEVDFTGETRTKTIEIRRRGAEGPKEARR